MKPLINSKTNEFIGVVIDTSEFNSPNTNQILSVGTMTSKQTEALVEVRALGLFGYAINGKVYGLKKAPQQISVVQSTTFGIRIGGGCSEESLCLGNDVVYGISMQLRPDSKEDFREKGGFYLEDPITKFVKAAGVLTNSVSLRETIEDILQLSAIQADQIQSLERERWPTKLFPKLATLRAADFNLETSDPVPVSSMTLKEKLAELNQPGILETERRTQKFIEKVNAHAPIWNSQRAQSYVQRICDRISDSTLMPAKCRVFADMFPYAFSYPGGAVFINAGLLALAEDEALITFYIAHELSHIYARHFSETLAKKDFEAKFFNTLSLLGTVLSTQSTRGLLIEKFGAAITQKTSAEIYSSLMTNYTYDQEIIADQFAFSIAQELGFTSKQIVSSLKKYADSIKLYYNDDEKPQAKLKVRALNLSARIEILKKKALASPAADQNQADQEPSQDFREIRNQLLPAYDFVRYSMLAK